MENLIIKAATAQYTGGGIYIYYGKLENGLYFRGCDDWESIAICTEDTEKEEADYQEFYEAHLINELTGNDYKTFFNNMIDWIINNSPTGNYLKSELEERVIK